MSMFTVSSPWLPPLPPLLTELSPPHPQLYPSIFHNSSAPVITPFLSSIYGPALPDHTPTAPLPKGWRMLHVAIKASSPVRLCERCLQWTMCIQHYKPHCGPALQQHPEPLLLRKRSPMSRLDVRTFNIKNPLHSTYVGLFGILILKIHSLSAYLSVLEEGVKCRAPTEEPTGPGTRPQLHNCWGLHASVCRVSHNCSNWAAQWSTGQTVRVRLGMCETSGRFCFAFLVKHS